jgi:uncharacterized Zn finger protein (UPF0148 family)
VSIPGIDLDCDKCGYQGGDSVVWGDFRYVDGECEIPLNRTLGWCANCQALVAIEDFSDREEVAAEIEKILDEVSIVEKKWRSISLFSNRRKQRLARLEQLAGVTKRHALIERRKGHEKCLSCGSVNVSRFEGDYSQIDSFTYSQKIIHTGYFEGVNITV